MFTVAERGFSAYTETRAVLSQFFTVLTFNPQQSEAENWSVSIQLLMATRSYVKQLACLTNILLLINEHSSVNEQSCISLR